MASQRGRRRRGFHRVGTPARDHRHAHFDDDDTRSGRRGRSSCERREARRSCSTSTTGRCCGVLSKPGDGASRYADRRTRQQRCSLLCRIATSSSARRRSSPSPVPTATCSRRSATSAADGCDARPQAGRTGLYGVRFRSNREPRFGRASVPGFPVEVFNTVGAGDAFLPGFLKAWLDGAPWDACGRLGNACGALVVARHGCTPAMPSQVELDCFLALRPTPFRPRFDANSRTCIARRPGTTIRGRCAYWHSTIAASSNCWPAATGGRSRTSAASRGSSPTPCSMSRAAAAAFATGPSSITGTATTR